MKLKLHRRLRYPIPRTTISLIAVNHDHVALHVLAIEEVIVPNTNLEQDDTLSPLLALPGQEIMTTPLVVFPPGKIRRAEILFP